MPESCVIFITENDVIGDGTHIIYINGSFKGEKGNPLDDLIHEFFCANPAEMRHKQLADRVKFLKKNKNEVNSMSSIIAEFFKDEIAEAAQKAAEKAEAEGKEKTLIENIRNAM